MSTGTVTTDITNSMHVHSGNHKYYCLMKTLIQKCLTLGSENSNTNFIYIVWLFTVFVSTKLAWSDLLSLVIIKTDS